MVFILGGTRWRIQARASMYIVEKVLMLRKQTIEKFKVQWKHFGPHEATWEMADQM